MFLHSKEDEKILEVILQTIGDHPDELKYQRLNIKNLSKILSNSALALDFLLKLGFDYTSNKIYLKFIGITQSQRTKPEVSELSILMQCAIRACARAAKNTKETFKLRTMMDNKNDRQETTVTRADIVAEINAFLEMVCIVV